MKTGEIRIGRNMSKMRWCAIADCLSKISECINCKKTSLTFNTALPLDHAAWSVSRKGGDQEKENQLYYYSIATQIYSVTSILIY